MVQVHYGEGVATHTGPEPCAAADDCKRLQLTLTVAASLPQLGVTALIAASRPSLTFSGVAENALDIAGGKPIDLSDLRNRHAIFHEGADAGKLRARDRARRLLLGADRGLDLLDAARRHREDPQHTRLARRLVGWRGVGNRWPADWRFCYEQRFRRLPRSGDRLVIIARRVRLLSSAKQDFPQKVASIPITESDSRILARLAKPVPSGKVAQFPRRRKRHDWYGKLHRRH